MITTSWLMFTAMTLFLLVGVSTRTWQVLIMSAMFSLWLFLHAYDNLTRMMWGGAGIIIILIAFGIILSNRKNSDTY